MPQSGESTNQRGNGPNGEFELSTAGSRRGRSSRSPQSVVLNDLVPPIQRNSSSSQTWTVAEKTGRYSQESPLPKSIPYPHGQSPTMTGAPPAPTNRSGTYPPIPPNAQYPSGSANVDQRFFFPILTQESFPAFTPATYSNWRREIKLRPSPMTGSHRLTFSPD